MGKNAQRKRLAKLHKKQAEKRQLQDSLNKKIAEHHSIETPTKPTPAPKHPNLAVTSEDIVRHVKGKKVIAFLQEMYDCCTEKCIVEYTRNFQNEGYACLVVPRDSYTDILKYLANYVVLFRTGYKDCTTDQAKNLLAYIAHLRGLGIRIVYYADDMIFWMNQSIPLVLIKASDAVIVANESLRDVLRTKGQVHQPIHVVRTHVQLHTFDNLPAVSPVPLSNRFKVLLSSQGRVGINHAYEICEIANQDPDLSNSVEWVFNASGVAQIRSVVNRFRNLKKTYIDWISLNDYYQLIKSVNLIIHPADPRDLEYFIEQAKQGEWLNCKSEVKYTMAGAASIPIISSPVASYKYAIKDGQTGFLANTPQEFVDRIKELKNTPSLYSKIGQAARADIVNNYSADKRYPEYRDAIVGTTKKAVPTLVPTKAAGSAKTLFIPPIEGGPRTYYENMKRVLPVVTGGKWEVTDVLDTADAGVAIAFLSALSLIETKKARPDFKIIYRLDGLPMTFTGDYDEDNLSLMQSMFKWADRVVWQSKHCYNMWRERKLLPDNYNCDGPIIHNGVDLDIFKRDGVAYNFPGAKTFNFLNLNWSTFNHKRIDLLKEVIRSYEFNESVRFYLIGNYVSTSQLENVNFWRGYPNVTYLGQMRNQSRQAKDILASIYRAATALIFTSEMEGSPNTILEALGCGCPVIYNDVVDIVPEILGDKCLPLKDMDDIFKVPTRERLQDTAALAEEFSMESCARKYIQLLGE